VSKLAAGHVAKAVL